jgi:hypothetical protein
VAVISRVAGFGSRGWFFLSVFGRCGTGAEAEAVIPGLKDVAVVGKSIEEGCGHFGIRAYSGHNAPSCLCFLIMMRPAKPILP